MEIFNTGNKSFVSGVALLGGVFTMSHPLANFLRNTLSTLVSNDFDITF